MDLSSRQSETNKTPAWGIIFQIAGLALVLLLGYYFRTTGLMWGEYQYPHPDERFLVWVVADIAPVEAPGDYFNTAASTLNPANRNHAFYVYGDLPVILTRYVADASFKTTGWQEILQTGRSLSTAFDLLTVLLVYLIANRLGGRYANWKVATLAGLFSAGAVLQIQQAHFFTVDSFSTAFTTLAIYLGVVIATEEADAPLSATLGASLLFGLAVGLAMACKINTAPVALLLPVALAARFLRYRLAAPKAPKAADEDEMPGESSEPGPAAVNSPAFSPTVRLISSLAGFALAGGVVAFLAFRIAQPYAFSGPSFFNMSIDKGWMQSMRDLSAQSAGDVDFPPALQWADRNHLFSLQNLLVWGLGLPLGLMGWFGFFYYAVRAFMQLRARQFDKLLADAGLLLVWGWTAFYFTWQSMAWNPTMRYQLPIYPTLAILAAWVLGELWKHPLPRFKRPGLWRVGVGLTGAIVLLVTLAWAFAFTRIYTRPETRVDASRWIYENVPGPLALKGAAVVDQDGSSSEEPWQQLLPLREGTSVRSDAPYLAQFDALQTGALVSVHLPQVSFAMNQTAAAGELLLRARFYDPARPDETLAIGQVKVQPGGNFDPLDLPVDGLPIFEAGQRYGMALEILPPDGSVVGASPDADRIAMSANLSSGITLNLYARPQTVTYVGQDGALSALTLKDGGTLRRLRLTGQNDFSMVNILLQEEQTESVQSASAILPVNSSGGILAVDPPLKLKPGVKYLIGLTSSNPGHPLDSSQPVQIDFLDDPLTQYLPSVVQESTPNEPLYVPFTVQKKATLRQVVLAHAAQEDVGADAKQNLTLRITRSSDQMNPLAQVLLDTTLSADKDPRGGEVTFTIDPPLELSDHETYMLSLAPTSGRLAVRGSAVANETNWDMGLPFRVDNYDAFGGIYRGDLNFDMYADDNPEKYQRFVNILQQADAIFFSSNRQWGTTTRMSMRFPLTTEFYRQLLGCPPEREVQWCYNVAEPGMFKGQLGFDLVQTFTSYPNLGSLRFNTQFAEEAFTVYDAPKVMIFEKQADYDPAKVEALLGAVDLDKVVRVTPKKVGAWKDLQLKPTQWAAQQAGGTFAALFPPEGLLNRYPGLGLAAWYLFLLLLGGLTYPILRLALPGLNDRGYPLARTAGLVLLAYGAWLSGSLGLTVSRGLLAGVFGLIALVGLVFAYLQRGELREEWHSRRKYFLAVELVALAFFAIDLAIRFANPDLWHPIFGGEKPMDFSFFNAVLKSSVFPPYDPWFAGGYINYYYYGFVLVGMPVKLLGITPSVAYNLVLPALFSLVALGAFSTGWNLYTAVSDRPSGNGRRTHAAREDAGGRDGLVDPADPQAGDAPRGTLVSRGNFTAQTASSSRVEVAPFTPLNAPSTPSPRAGAENPAASEDPDKIARRAEFWQRAEVEHPTEVPSQDVHASQSAYASRDAFDLHDDFASSDASDSRDSFALPSGLFRRALLAGLAAAVALLILGNLGTVRMIWQGWQLSVVSEDQMRAGSIPDQLTWVFQGISKAISGGDVHQYYTGDWYWKPSRAIQPEAGNEITEFPFFTFLYADLHAHLMALPVTLLVLGWALAMALGKGRWGLRDGRLKWVSLGAALFMGALAAGALRPANTWDQYTYLALAAIALAYGQWRGAEGFGRGGSRTAPTDARGLRGIGLLLWILGPVVVLVGLAVLLYQPFDAWFAQGYNQLDVWKGDRTGLSSYLVHWGLFLFVIAAWLFDEVVDWMAHTPLSAFNRLRNVREEAAGGAVMMVVLLALLLWQGVWIALIVLPLGVTAALLLFRRGQPEAKRAVLFMTGTALALTLAVELVAVHGDIGRMNTVFKFYYQAWTLLALSAAAALFWLWPRIAAWHSFWANAWKLGLALLVLGAALYPIKATQAKIQDRMMADSPLSLDGMAYMETARYTDGQSEATMKEMDLGQDYRAIRWMQANVPGTPVIVEANAPEYRHWGTRYTIYTGLPGVIGWNWHERQQRTITPDTWVYDRIDAVNSFYQTEDPDKAAEFLKRYAVQYIIVGQMERVWYGPDGMAKFDQQNGKLWDEVYREGETVIYKVR